MNILTQNKELTKRELYTLTESPSVISVKDLEDGTVIEVDKYLLYEDINSQDEPVELLSILDKDGQAYATQSATFKRQFRRIAEIFGDEDFSVKKISGTTKNGRPYVNCDLF